MDKAISSPKKNEVTMDRPTVSTPRRRSSSVVSTGSPAKSARRKSTSLPPETVEYLKNWMMSPEHIAHPYPTEREKAQIMADTGIELKQLTNWFVNNRKRFWKPRVEARLQQQAHVQAAAAATAVAAALINTPNQQAALSPAPSMTVNNTAATLTHVVSTPSVAALVEKALAITTPLAGTTVPMVRGVSPLNSPTRTMISEQSSPATTSADESGSVSSMEQEDEPSVSCCAPAMPMSLTLRSETIDIHVLRPVSGQAPSLKDVTVLNSVPQERILRTFYGCDLTYNVPEIADRKKEQNRRNAEIVRMKKQCLETYLAEVSSPIQLCGLKRARSHEDDVELQPKVTEPLVLTRPRFRRKSLEVWKEVCQKADHVYSESLPSLEEASKLFGYSED